MENKHPNIVFVDEHDCVIGAGPRKRAVEEGIVHRIVRVFLFNSQGETLVQKRAAHLNSLPNKWDHSAAGHVDEGEEYLEAAYRELEEEVGVRGVELTEAFKMYTELREDGVIKKRFNMLYTGVYDGVLHPDPEEVAEVKWIAPKKLLAWMEQEPNAFTQGFIKTFKELMSRREDR